MKNILFLLLAFVGAAANATVIRADFTTKTDLPYCERCQDWRLGPMTRQALGQSVGTGTELGGNAVVTNPSEYEGGVVHVDLDPLAQTLTLRSQDDWDFEHFSVQVANILFSSNQVITGLTLLSDNLTEDFVTTPRYWFTNNGLFIEYDSPLGFYFTMNEAVFAYTTADRQAVPEPVTLGLLGIGLAGLLAGRRRA